MKGRELGLLLLTSHLGRKERKTLTVAQMKKLGERVEAHPGLIGDILTTEHLLAMGCTPELARQIMTLLSEKKLAEDYIRRGERLGMTLLTWFDPRFPDTLRKRLKGECPPILWVKGDLELLNQRAVSIVGSRDIKLPNSEFARTVGTEAAKHGYVLVTGRAPGADQQAMATCMQAGGSVIAVVPDSLLFKNPAPRELFVSLYDYDADFSSPRALERNHVIHSWGYATFVAQSSVIRSGTWSGTNHNLKNHLSPVLFCDDGSEAMSRAVRMGARNVDIREVKDFEALWEPFYRQEEPG